MLICPKESCSGCAACVNRCPVNAICLCEDCDGFLMPVIDERRCMDCGLCRRICPALAEVGFRRLEEPLVYAAWSLDRSVRISSTSGGVFSVLAARMLMMGGSVWGAGFDGGLRLRHVEVNSIARLSLLRGAKYLQSDVGNAYAKVELKLKQGGAVLFSGTPCQVAGLYGYLGGEVDGLVTCELVCHGVPCQRSFDEYLDFLRKDGCPYFDSLSFRDTVTSARETTLIDNSTTNRKVHRLAGCRDYYQRAFMKGLMSRRSCYDCKFARLPRVADFTLGDFWGLGDELAFTHDKSSGVSLLLVNSEQGKEYLSHCTQDLFLERRTLGEATRKNQRICQSGDYQPERDSFLADIRSLPINDVCKRYDLLEGFSLRGLMIRFFKPLLIRLIPNLLVGGK